MGVCQSELHLRAEHIERVSHTNNCLTNRLGRLFAKDDGDMGLEDPHVVVEVAFSLEPAQGKGEGPDMSDVDN